ncbi:MAG: hypothetical protein JRG96_20300 [Deltaproteobacteria bacterium]|nr:hypothetical protein [Deltaproteobacteria bacterium]
MSERATTSRSKRKTPVFGLAVASAVLGLTACQSNNAAEGIAFREARFERMQAQQSYEKCVDEAVELDSQARSTRSPAQYLASARLLERCEQDLGPHADRGMDERRMRAYALSVQNNFKGGDVARARENLEQLRISFPKRDLFYSDGSSFTDSMSVLLGEVDVRRTGHLGLYNIPDDLRSELLRARYWQRH